MEINTWIWLRIALIISHFQLWIFIFFTLLFFLALLLFILQFMLDQTFLIIQNVQKVRVNSWNKSLKFLDLLFGINLFILHFLIIFVQIKSDNFVTVKIFKYFLIFYFFLENFGFNLLIMDLFWCQILYSFLLYNCSFLGDQVFVEFRVRVNQTSQFYQL